MQETTTDCVWTNFGWKAIPNGVNVGNWDNWMNWEGTAPFPYRFEPAKIDHKEDFYCPHCGKKLKIRIEADL